MSPSLFRGICGCGHDKLLLNINGSHKKNPIHIHIVKDVALYLGTVDITLNLLWIIFHKYSKAQPNKLTIRNLFFDFLFEPYH